MIGLIIANTVGSPAVFRRGVATYDFWPKTGIVLLGARFIRDDVARLGGISNALVFIEIALALAFMTWLGKRDRDRCDHTWPRLWGGQSISSLRESLF